MTEIQAIKMDKQGRVQIPIEFRKALNLDAGSEIVSWVDDDHLVLQPRAVLLANLQARLDPIKESLVDELAGWHPDR
jgi:AbrB family looped-hinge helix DNA binding protein